MRSRTTGIYMYSFLVNKYPRGGPRHFERRGVHHLRFPKGVVHPMLARGFQGRTQKFRREGRSTTRQSQREGGPAHVGRGSRGRRPPDANDFYIVSIVTFGGKGAGGLDPLEPLCIRACNPQGRLRPFFCQAYTGHFLTIKLVGKFPTSS